MIFHFCNDISVVKNARIIAIRKQIVTIIIDFIPKHDILNSLAGNLNKYKEIAEMELIFSDEKRMDRFDALVCEYLRSNRKTVEYLSEKVGCNPSSLWRYRKKTEYFKKAPLDVVAGCFRMSNASNEDIRYILGLPTGKNEN